MECRDSVNSANPLLMKELLSKLKRPLTREDVDFRVGSLITKGTGDKLKVYATILAYKDARTDMKVLDDATDGLWQNEYRRDSKGVLQCGIGIKFADEWIWKWSNGVESKTEAVKGEYSDALKRAGFMWGIGRELYEVPTLFITLDKDEFYMDGSKAKASNKFRPNDWTWEITNEMKTFKATDKAGKVRLTVDESEAPEDQPEEPKPPVTPRSPVVNPTAETCNKCGAPMAISKKGNKYCTAKCWLEPQTEAKPMTNADLVPNEAPDETIRLEDIPF